MDWKNMSLKINTITLILGFFAFNSVLAAENKLENLRPPLRADPSGVLEV